MSVYHQALGFKCEAVLRKVKINKISGSNAAAEENKRIYQTLKLYEKQFLKQGEDLLISEKINEIIETDISKYNSNELAQFIRVDNDMIRITEYLNKKFELDKETEMNIDEFTKNVFTNIFKIDGGFEKFFNS